MTQKETRVAPNVVVGTLQLKFCLFMYCLTLGQHTYLLLLSLWGKLGGGNPCKKDNEFVISSPLGKTVNINHMYKRVQFVINKCELKVDLLTLELHNFDVILGMD
jgi:hypothetical protein